MRERSRNNENSAHYSCMPHCTPTILSCQTLIVWCDSPWTRSSRYATLKPITVLTKTMMHYQTIITSMHLKSKRLMTCLVCTRTEHRIILFEHRCRRADSGRSRISAWYYRWVLYKQSHWSAQCTNSIWSQHSRYKANYQTIMMLSMCLVALFEHVQPVSELSWWGYSAGREW